MMVERSSDYLTMKGFLQFIREQGVVGLAVGFILGGAVSKVVSALVGDIIQPLLGIALGAAKGLSSASVGFFGAEIKYGDFIGVLIDFAIVAGVVYFIFKSLKLDQIDLKK